MKCLSKKLVPVALVFSMLWLAACEKNPTASKSPRPDLPPQSSMAVDLQAFNNNNAAGLSKTGAGQTAVGLHFVAARLTVGAINLAVLAHTSVPVLTFAAALSQPPALQDDAKWHWIYSVSNNAGQQFQADLAGWIDESAKVSRWKMRISTTGLGAPLNNFLWYEGQAALNNSSGQWDIYDSAQPANSVKVVHIDWDRPSAGQATLKFTVVKPQVPENGDVLTYNVDGTGRMITLFDQSVNTTLDISWDAVTNAGYIIAPNYNNGQKSCWDSQLNDTTCQ